MLSKYLENGTKNLPPMRLRVATGASDSFIVLDCRGGILSDRFKESNKELERCRFI